MADLKSVVIAATEVSINGKVVPVAEFPSFKAGKPTIKPLTSVSGDKVHVAFQKDYSEAVSEVNLTFRNLFEVFTTIDDCQNRIGDNEIIITDSAGKFTRSFTGMSVVEDPEHNFNDETFSVVFKGNPAT